MTDDELRELANKATPGPWRFFDLQMRNHWAGIAVVARDPSDPLCECDVAELRKGSEHNAAFIAAADPVTILSLLDRLNAAASKP